MSPEPASTRIHPTAIVDPEARIDPTTSIGPYCVIEGPVRIGPRNRILAYTFIAGATHIGADNAIGPHACLGTEPQSLSDYPPDTGVAIGDGNTIREFAQVHRSIAAGQPTRMGDRNFLMAGGHVAHDCIVGNQCVLTNGAMLSGHCVIGDGANISSPVGVHQFVRVGRLAFIATHSCATLDVPPFTIVEGRNRVRGLNTVGMRRAGIDAQARREVKRVYNALYFSGRGLRHALAQLADRQLCPEARELVDFCRVKSQRGIMAHARSHNQNQASDTE